jgi:hypothetical protein
MFHLSNGRDGENGSAAVAPKAESIPTPAPVSVPASIPAPAPPQTPVSELLPTQTSNPGDGFDEFDPRGSFSGNTSLLVFTTI